jgi:hypothetical protein
MKCVVCVNRSLDKKDVSNDTPVQEGVDGAKDAVVVYKGESLCVEHLHERLVYLDISDFIRAVSKNK